MPISTSTARAIAWVARAYPAVKSGSFAVDLGFAGLMPQGLSPGATAEGKLSLGGDSKALVLAAGPFLEASGGDFVFVLDAGGKSAHRRRVKLGRRNAEQVEVLSGLNAGERVITRCQWKLRSAVAASFRSGFSPPFRATAPRLRHYRKTASSSEAVGAQGERFGSPGQKFAGRIHG